MVGTTAAIVIGLSMAGSTAASMYSASKQAGAAKDAANAQAQASRQAMAFNNQQWNRMQQLQQPYIQAGQQSASLLGGLMTPQGVKPGQWQALQNPPGLMTPQSLYQPQGPPQQINPGPMRLMPPGAQVVGRPQPLYGNPMAPQTPQDLLQAGYLM